MKSERNGIYSGQIKFFAGFSLCCAAAFAGCGTDSAVKDAANPDCDCQIEHETFFDPEDTEIEVIYD